MSGLQLSQNSPDSLVVRMSEDGSVVDRFESVAEDVIDAFAIDVAHWAREIAGWFVAGKAEEI